VNDLFANIALLAIGDSGWGDELLLGLWGTAKLALVALPFGLVGGLLLALAKDANEVSWRISGNLITSVLRGLPELVTVILVFVLGQHLLQQVTEWSGLGDYQVSSFTAGVIALAVVFAAYASEAFLGAMKSLDDTLLDAARSLALGRWATLRFIVGPEILRLTLPELSNLWLSLLKQTALVSALSYPELLHQGSIAAAGSGKRLFFFGAVFLGYLLLTAFSAAVLSWLDRQLNCGRMA
jgi:polar amino acid transport system permease protein